jgi:hypothetical protein
MAEVERPKIEDDAAGGAKVPGSSPTVAIRAPPPCVAVQRPWLRRRYSNGCRSQ